MGSPEDLLKSMRSPLRPEAKVKDEQWRRQMGVRVVHAAEHLIGLFEGGFSLGDAPAEFFHEDLKVNVVYVPEQRHVAVQVFRTTNEDDRRPLSERAWSPLIQWLVPQEWVMALRPPEPNHGMVAQAAPVQDVTPCSTCNAMPGQPHHQECPRSRPYVI